MFNKNQISRDLIPQRVKFSKILGTVVFSSLLLVSCSSTTKEATSTEAMTNPAESVSVENCGRTVTLDKKPERILAVHPAMTEMLISIGAKDQMIGHIWGQANDVTDEFQKEVDEVENISDDIPSQEHIVELSPDMIVASGDFWFDGTRLQELDYFEQKGIPVFINSSACGAPSNGKYENVWKDLQDLGKLTRNEAAAKTRIDELKQQVDDVVKNVGKEKTAVMIQVYEGDIYAFSQGLYTEVLNMAGLKNLFDGEIESDSGFSKVSTEAILAKDPDYLLVTYATPDSKDKDVSAANDSLKQLKAVSNNKVIAISENTFVGGIGTPLGIISLAENIA